MNDWIPFENATYLAEEAFLVASDNTAVSLERTSIEVYTGKAGKKRLKGSGLIQNTLMVALLEESDDLDLILDLGGEFKYLMKTPTITAGKFFLPNVKSHLQFHPIAPWKQISATEFAKRVDALKLL
ncbi:MAG: hypothetical protein JRF39_06785 [Deltaproteobacteria bacterium]|nr:hypothetical protein [Deltaproteobacteria bacterium]